MNELFDKCITSGDLTRDEIITLLSLKDEEQIAQLMSAADEVRKRFCGDEVHIRGLLEFSNTCRNDCLYCGLRRSNRAVNRYQMPPDEIVDVAAQLARKGFGTVVL